MKFSKVKQDKHGLNYFTIDRRTSSDESCEKFRQDTFQMLKEFCYKFRYDGASVSNGVDKRSNTKCIHFWNRAENKLRGVTKFIKIGIYAKHIKITAGEDAQEAFNFIFECAKRAQKRG